MTIEDVYSRYLLAVREIDRRGALTVVESALEAGFDWRDLYLNVFQPTLREIGRLWEHNLISVADEHFTTALTESAMLMAYSRCEMTKPAGRLLIAACAESERHEVGLRMVCDFVEMEGWDTVFLGSAVPPESLARMVRDRNPDVVALSASIPAHVDQIRKAIEAIRGASAGSTPLIIAGGPALLSMRGREDALGVDFIAADAAEAATWSRQYAS